MHVAVIGTGYVGLVTGACLTETGNDVIRADTVEAKIARLNAREIPEGFDWDTDPSRHGLAVNIALGWHEWERTRSLGA